jgi:heme/copper-type cytochrome/quinol oxidase subunit 3
MTTATLNAPAPRTIPRRLRPRIPNGRLGMWWFLGSEIVTFGGVVTSYLLLRLCHPEWMKQSSETLLPIGATNTVVLLTSSLTMVLAHAAAHDKDRGRTIRWMLITLVLGLLFLCFKGFEYSHEIAHHHVPTEHVFWTFYYCMTGLHALHVIGGLVAMAVIALSLRRRETWSRVEVVGLYWHFVDIVWIFLFPLLYVTSQA